MSSNLGATLNSWSPRVLDVLRIVTALLFMAHGLMKIFHFPEAMAEAPDPLPPLIVVAAWMEIVGGVLLVLGLFTRLVAFLTSGEMAIAYFMYHAGQSFYPILNNGESAILFCFIFLYLVFAGPGPWSLDAVVRKRA